MNEDTTEEAKRNFNKCEAELLRALNGIDRPVGRQKEIVELRRELMRAQHACESLGIEAETLWEFAQKRRKVDESKVRTYAEEQSHIAPAISFSLRRQIAAAVGLTVAIGCLVRWPTLGGLLVSLPAGLFTFALADSILSDRFPAAPTRVARMACDLDVDVSSLWTKGSHEFNDYVHAYKVHAWRKKGRGEPSGWIKAR